MTEKRFALKKDYDCDGSWEYCYQDNETGRRFNFADDNCDTDFLELVNAVIDDLKKENKDLKQIQQDYEDNVSNWFIENWQSLTDEQRQTAHLELGIELEDLK